jgi:beta-glucosidase
MIESFSRDGLPLVVTENGLADADDDQRPLLLLEHLYTVARALGDGYDVRGFYCWTISDNFE